MDHRTKITRLISLAFIWITLNACLLTTQTVVPVPAVVSPAADAVSTSGATGQPAGQPTQGAPAMTAAVNARPLELEVVGQPRSLPQQIFGASVEALIGHFTDNPSLIQAVKAASPAYLRFPGGSQSNYYDWQDGLLHFYPQSNSSAYYKYWAGLAPRIAQAFPQGISFEQYSAAAKKVGANVILVPNLETSTIDSQTTWFKKLAAENILPKDIEFGNEFWIAMAGDPKVMQIWPNEPSAAQIMQQYEQALRPIVGPQAKFAIQASAASFTILPTDPSPFSQRLLKWDQDLTPANWFDAVTVHLYPSPEKIAAEAPNATPQESFEVMMGTSDSGIDRALNDVAARLPGKEIWVTEWNPRGGNFTTLNNPQTDKVPPQMNAQLMARTLLAFLRHPEVTKELFFMLYAGNDAMQSYVLSGGQYVPMVQTVVLTWFDGAANGGSSFQRVIEKSAAPVTGLGPFKESYQPVEGGLFHSSQGTTLILQNASADPRLYTPIQTGGNTKPTRVEVLVADNFTDTSHQPAQVISLDPSGPITLPPYSISRISW